MPDRARFVINIALLLLITLLARPASAYVLSWQTESSNQSNSELPELSAPANSREGYFVLSLSKSPTQDLIVEYSTDEEFREINRTYAWFGDFQDMTLTGFSDGTHYFRLKVSSSEPAENTHQETQLSNVVQVQVDHYALEQALTLFSLGGVLFAILVVIILYQHQRSRAHE
ncbi:hypothetical protein [Pseudidiomarina marina]|uniref:Uncharacterized protein n=1 Tax=Pseudidiomarina marina TaxID=502366 RepID=A0A432YIY3_9GAMM|nr:hypothetical protein [Pseudidiomarina marina]RUO60914.1 hypothetical protein CWI76_01135 [Pseudidiomarina marina]